MTETVRLQGISKTFGGTSALGDVSFEIAPGTVHALCGENGSGKSTLIKILAGVHQADSGRIEIGGHSYEAARITPGWAGSVGLHFVHQSVGTFAELSVAENFALGSDYGVPGLAPIRWRSVERRAQEVLDRLNVGVSAKAKMGELSPATQTMVAVARALQGQSGGQTAILVLDEPTASLHAREADTVLAAIRGYVRDGHTVLFVTHRLHEVLEVCDVATFLRDGRHIETRSMEGLDERYLIRQITGSEVGSTGRGDSETGERPVRLQLRDYSVGPLRGVALQAGAGEILGISGLVGSGRSLLLKSLFGDVPRGSGTAMLDGELLAFSDPAEAIERGVSYVPSDRANEASFAELPITKNLTAPCMGRFWKLYFRNSAERRRAQEDISRYRIAAGSEVAPMSTLSGGNQQKVVMARWLGMAPRLLLLDEPTQGVDVGARASIHRHIRDAAAQGVTVLVVSSDAEELAELCDRVVGIWQGRITGEIKGGQITAQRCIELAYGLTGGREALAQFTKADT